MAGLPDPVHKLLAKQADVVARRQLINDLGYDRGSVDGWVQRGHLEPMHRGIFRRGRGIRPPAQQLYANVLRAGEGARADGAACLALLGVEGFKLADHAGVLVPSSRDLAVSFSIRHRRLPSSHLATVCRLPGLTLCRSLIDAAEIMDIGLVRSAADALWRRGLLSHDRLCAFAERNLDLPGSEAVLAQYRHGAFEKENEGERAFEEFLSPLGLELEWGVEDLVPGRRLDALCRPLLLIFEFDGRAYHVLPNDRDSDGLRDLECSAVVANGVTLKVVRVTSGMMLNNRAKTLEALARLVEQRRQEILAAARRLD